MTLLMPYDEGVLAGSRMVRRSSASRRQSRRILTCEVSEAEARKLLKLS